MQGAELAAAEQAATSTKQEMEALAWQVGQRLPSLQVPNNMDYTPTRWP